MKNLAALLSAILLLNFTAPTHALVGAGFHWGFDFSLKMDDSFNNFLSAEGFSPSPLLSSLNTQVQNQLGISSDSLLSLLSASPITSGQLPLTISREGFERHVLNFGGKLFVDIIPVIDAIEISCNFGLWQYEGAIHYPTGINTALQPADLNNAATLTYNDVLDMSGTMPLTLEQFNIGFFGLTKTPYAKLHFDATVRKNIIAVPDKMKIFRLYAGGGPTLHMQTPVLTPKLVQDVIGDALANAAGNTQAINDLMTNTETMKKIVTEIISGFNVPKFGMHIAVGTMIKLPVVPVGFYVDGKYAIPFGDLNEEAGITGFGLLFNAGITIGL